ncbi:MAG: hypothetical protein U0T83_06785 [Bacteriovoracaceae bacterium]
MHLQDVFIIKLSLFFNSNKFPLLAQVKELPIDLKRAFILALDKTEGKAQ